MIGTLIQILFYRKGYIMKNKLTQLFTISNKINRTHIQMIFAILALAMLVLGAGAPTIGGGGGG